LDKVATKEAQARPEAILSLILSRRMAAAAAADIAAPLETAVAAVALGKEMQPPVLEYPVKGTLAALVTMGLGRMRQVEAAGLEKPGAHTLIKKVAMVVTAFQIQSLEMHSILVGAEAEGRRLAGKQVLALVDLVEAEAEDITLQIHPYRIPAEAEGRRLAQTLLLELQGLSV
jgi:hypothetical protein